MAQDIEKIDKGSLWQHRLTQHVVRVLDVDDKEVFWQCLSPKGRINGQNVGQMSINNFLANCDQSSEQGKGGVVAA